MNSSTEIPSLQVHACDQQIWGPPFCCKIYSRNNYIHDHNSRSCIKDEVGCIAVQKTGAVLHWGISSLAPRPQGWRVLWLYAFWRVASCCVFLSSISSRNRRGSGRHPLQKYQAQCPHFESLSYRVGNRGNDRNSGRGWGGCSAQRHRVRQFPPPRVCLPLCEQLRTSSGRWHLQSCRRRS